LNALGFNQTRSVFGIQEKTEHEYILIPEKEYPTILLLQEAWKECDPELYTISQTRTYGRDENEVIVQTFYSSPQHLIYDRMNGRRTISNTALGLEDICGVINLEEDDERITEFIDGLDLLGDHLNSLDAFDRLMNEFYAMHNQIITDNTHFELRLEHLLYAIYEVER
jgi:hypothetical protein